MHKRPLNAKFQFIWSIVADLQPPILWSSLTLLSPFYGLSVWRSLRFECTFTCREMVLLNWMLLSFMFQYRFHRVVYSLTVSEFFYISTFKINI